MAREMTFLEFQAAGKRLHFNQLSADLQEGWAVAYKGKEVLVYPGGPCIALEEDGTAWFEDYKERFSGPVKDIERKYYEHLFCEDSLPIVA